MSVCKHSFRSSFISYFIKEIDKLDKLVVSYAYLRVVPTSRVFTSGHVNTETILHFFIVEFFNKHSSVLIWRSVHATVSNIFFRGEQ